MPRFSIVLMISLMASLTLLIMLEILSQAIFDMLWNPDAFAFHAELLPVTASIGIATPVITAMCNS
jgi:uncharacterized membrane protein